MVYSKPQLSLWEKLTLVFALLRALNNGFLAAITAPFRGNSGASKFTNHVKVALLRTALKATTVRQVQAITPTIDEAYPQFAKKEGFPPSQIETDDGTKAYWIGKPNSEKVTIWSHGGGFNIPPDPGHLPYAATLTTPTTSILMLSYTLAPHATYPTQLRQAISLLRHLLINLHYSPSSISLAGDSAGANLSLGVISHILHPHPQIPPLDLSEPLQSAILMAPWCSFATNWPSNHYNAGKDIVSAAVGNKWSSSFLGGAPRDAYNEPLSADEKWFEGLSKVVDQVFICAGADEVLVDPIRELSRRFEKVHGKVTTVIAKDEWHDKPVVLALGGGGEQADAVREFVRGRL